MSKCHEIFTKFIAYTVKGSKLQKNDWTYFEPPPLPLYKGKGGGLTSSNLAISVGMKHFFSRKGGLGLKEGGLLRKGGGGTLHFYIKFS